MAPQHRRSLTLSVQQLVVAAAQETAAAATASGSTGSQAEQTSGGKQAGVKRRRGCSTTTPSLLRRQSRQTEPCWDVCVTLFWFTLLAVWHGDLFDTAGRHIRGTPSIVWNSSLIDREASSRSLQGRP
jgi:hypothetical protein